MILQKSARFLMIFLCAIMFHGNVFGASCEFQHTNGNYYTAYTNIEEALNNATGCTYSENDVNNLCAINGAFHTCPGSEDSYVVMPCSDDPYHPYIRIQYIDGKFYKTCTSETALTVNGFDVVISNNGFKYGSCSYDITKGFNTNTGLDKNKCAKCGVEHSVLQYNDEKNDVLLRTYEINKCVLCRYDDHCIDGDVCRKVDDTYSRGEDGHCVENNICASADGSCLTAGCGMVDDNCQQCSGETPYSLYIPAKEKKPEHNICVSSSINNATCSGNVCTCFDGFVGGDGFVLGLRKQDAGCYIMCSGVSFSNSDTDGQCQECDGILLKDSTGILNIGCGQCGANEQPNSNHTACVCKKGYGRDTENGACRKCGGTDHPGETSVPDDSGYKCEKVGFGMIPKYDNNLGVYFEDINCKDSEPIANYDNSVCVDSCTNTGFNNETGYGKYTKNNYSQCVKCADYDGQVSKPDNDNSGAYICAAECGAYQTVQPDGSCGYCSNDKFYDFDRKICVDTCNNSYPVSDENTNVNVCCGEYQYFDDKECKSCGSNQWFEPSGRTCESCPKNFVCNRKTKIKCPFGTVNEQNTDGTFNNSCVSLDISNSNNSNKGFLHNSNGIYEIVSEATYRENHEDSYYSGFEYAECSIVNGYAEHYYPLELTDPAEYADFTKVKFGSFYSDGRDIRVCHQCKDTERANASGVCLCGQLNNTNAGLIKDIVPERHGKICQVCPSNNVKKGRQDESYTCGPCSEDGKGFFWDSTKREFGCETCGGDTALYTGSNGMKWCLTHTELVAVMGQQDAESYYIGDNNVWDSCKAGSCCLEGKKYSCKKGTVSLANMVCDKGIPGQCFDCGGKTTKSEGTACDDGLSIDACKTNMCTESIVPTTFCFGGENKKEIGNNVANMCFKIEEIKMSLKEGAGVYNTIDITGQNNSGQ